MNTKEELRKKFEDLHCHNDTGELTVCSYPQNVFDFFYSEIEAREAEIGITEKANKAFAEEFKQLKAKISHLESVIVAADEVIKIFERPYEYNELQVRTILHKYNQLKTKSQS